MLFCFCFLSFLVLLLCVCVIVDLFSTFFLILISILKFNWKHISRLYMHSSN